MLMSVVSSAGLEASEQWCSGDPVEIIIAANGALVPVWVTSSALGVEHLVSVQLAQVSYTTTETGSGTAVKLEVVVPNDLLGSKYPTSSVVSVGPVGTFGILAQASGVSGQPMELDFDLPAQ
jgi:hypothetical protein